MINFRTCGPVLAVTVLVCMSCAAKETREKDHFGTSVNFPVFESAAEFFNSFNRSLKVILFHRLDGEPVDMEWMDPALREKLCLVVTINNHCGGG